ncbi:MAG TPA: CotH kinase family protein [Candidatus Dorea intestinavium]|nr:CotH kinase family protein [Candidatus Dorea intestinavium]
MIKNKYTNHFAVALSILMVLVTIVFMFSSTLGVSVATTTMQYETSLFDTDQVHTLDLTVDDEDWADLLENAANEEYIAADITIDGSKMNNVGIRAKGNSSLRTVQSSDSDRYSFKLEFDHYQAGQLFQGLDKIALNNIIQDNTYLKDYLSYQMMNAFDADAPLCSFIYITVNGEDWGLYLAVEGIEESFIQRNYGSSSDGQLYKPDSMDAGGNKEEMPEGLDEKPSEDTNSTKNPTLPNNNDSGNTPPNSGQQPRGGQPPDGGQRPDNGGQRPDSGGQPPDGGQQTNGEQLSTDGQQAEMGEAPEMGETPPNEQGEDASENDSTSGGDRKGGGMGGNSTDVALVYSDDNIKSYSNIFNNAKTNPTDEDKERLVEIIKQLNEGENLDEILDVDEVLRYFVVHNFLLSFDSYTGSLMHNYYLYEEEGKLSLIAWDYNLAFGAFAMGEGTSGEGTSKATTLINFPIDTPVSGTTMEERPLLNALLSNEEYLNSYHELFSEFITSYFDSDAFETNLRQTIALISPYVQKDPTAFCTYDEFVTGSETLIEFCNLRAESIKLQLDGDISTTATGQAEDSSNFVDGSAININDMGSQGNGGGMDDTNKAK